MKLIYVFLGSTAGVIVYSSSGVLFGIIAGAFVGYLLAEIILTKNRFKTMDARLTAYKLTLDNYKKLLQTNDVSPAPIEQSFSTDNQIESPAQEIPQPVSPPASEPSPISSAARVTPQTAPEDQAWEKNIKDGDEESVVLRYIKDYFTGGNLLVRVGVIILFFGIAFLLKYAAEKNMFPIEYRLISVIIGAVVMLVIGWRLKERRTKYALILQGGSVGIMYLTVFSALRLYQLIPPTLAFAVLLSICVLSAIIAVLQNSRTLAVIGAAGGFLAPVLTSTETGNHVLLFSYYVLLNFGILGIAWFKSWRPLNLVGFIFTFIIGSMWGYENYNPEYFSTTEPFLIIFFLFYVIIAVLFAFRQPPDLKGYVDGTLIFGTPIIAFGLQSVLVKPYEYGLAYSAITMGLFYISLSSILFKLISEKTPQKEMHMLFEALLAIGVVFGTVAIPLALDDRWTSAAWALEGCAIVWVGVRQNKILARIFGILLEIGAGFAIFHDYETPVKTIPVLNGYYIGALLVSFAGLFSGFYLYRWKEKIKAEEMILSTILMTWALLWWFGAGLLEIDRYVPNTYQVAVTLVFISASLAICDYSGTRLMWPSLRIPSRLLLPVMVPGLIAAAFNVDHPLSDGGYLAWPIAFSLNYWILYQYNTDKLNTMMRYQHAGALWLLIGLGGWEVSWWIDHLVQGAGTWPQIAWMLVPALTVLLVTKAGHRINWPVTRYKTTYFMFALVPVTIFLLIWSLFTNLTSKGDPWPITYLPFINPLDLAQAFSFITLAVWALHVRNELKMPFITSFKNILWAYAAVIFIWLNAILIRTLHYWAAVPFNTHAVMNSELVQASLSILWSVMALIIMILAHRHRMRLLWIIGAALLAGVVVKLFVIDLSNSGTVERIVSFVGVGILLLVIGYLAPLPPRKTEAAVTQ